MSGRANYEETCTSDIVSLGWRPVYRSETIFYHQLMCQTQNKHLRRAGTCVWQRIQSAETRAGVGFLFLNLILNEARRLKQKKSETSCGDGINEWLFCEWVYIWKRVLGSPHLFRPSRQRQIPRAEVNRRARCVSDPPLLEFRGFLSDFNLTLAIFNITFPAYFQFNKLIYFGKDSFSI